MTHEAVKCIKSEREALVSFKEGVIDIPGKLSSWVGEDCCQWKGVECDDSGHVTKLNLSNPAGRHRHFDYYERYQYYPTKAVVAISKNRNRPCAPTAVCSDICSTGVPYSRGRGWDVNSSFSRDVNASLSGEITRYLRNLSSLTHLDLEGNYNLSTKNFDWVSTSIGNLSSLKELDLSYNKMNGTIPESFGQLSKLVKLYLLENSWECVITEAQLMNLTRLEEFVLTTNNKSQPLVFNVKDNWRPPFKLKILHLESCHIGSNFPKWLQVQSELTYVILKNVEIKGTIPEEWFSMISSNLTHLDLSNNQIKGNLPHQLVFPNVTKLFLQSNLFSGTIPSNISDLMPSLQYLDLSENHLCGKIPLSILKIKHLNILVLRRNNLSGELPHHWNESQMGLRVVDISHNNICGKILSSMGFLGNLSILVLSNNNLSGEIPSSLQNFSIVSMDFGGNRLSGNLPSWIESDIFMLRLRSNLFNGIIPKKWCNLYKLHILDIAQNNLSGDIPNCFNNFIALVDHNTSGYEPIENYTENANIVTKGREYEYDRTLQLVTCIDLSGNSLTGGIPIQITSLTRLGDVNSPFSRDVNASLSGKITCYIGNVSSLTHLDLEGNSNLSTKNFDWVSTSIGNLSSLKELDLSYNKMNGTIPESFGQLSKLVKLYLLENSWECVITEAQLMNLTRLEEFVLTTNNKSQPLVFNVKDNWRPPFKLKILHLESCLIGPKFTKWLQVQSELTYVILKNVEIKGTIPEEWFSMISSNLAHLDLSNNQIKGNLPHQLVFPNVTKLFLQSNLFSGTILSNISDLMPSLQYLDLSENHLCGKIPLSISKIKHLNILVLRRNNLLGELPHHWNESQMGLRVVDISHNNICGKILSSMGFLGNLSILVLSNNNLSGEIPSSLKNCSIVSMDFGGNHLSGNLPSWIESDIFMLRLRSNLFSGIISKKWCNLYKLHILDLAQNNLSGGIPDCFNNFIAMVDHNTSGYEPIENYTKKANIVTKGREYEYDRTLQQEKSLLVRAIFPRKNSNIVAKGY
ncbi:receptor-like protein EIX2 [Quercus suber]|uniref:receptor-like protein EIX2 n=1 Tax=Quercus suber TaxID=58331 RepID=UPI000CE27C3B|nr:receptor-like protein EIX2 [Quercus suber]